MEGGRARGEGARQWTREGRGARRQEDTVAARLDDQAGFALAALTAPRWRWPGPHSPGQPSANRSKVKSSPRNDGRNSRPAAAASQPAAAAAGRECQPLAQLQSVPSASARQRVSPLASSRPGTTTTTCPRLRRAHSRRGMPTHRARSARSVVAGAARRGVHPRRPPLPDHPHVNTADPARQRADSGWRLSAPRPPCVRAWRW